MKNIKVHVIYITIIICLSSILTGIIIHYHNKYSTVNLERRKIVQRLHSCTNDIELLRTVEEEKNEIENEIYLLKRENEDMRKLLELKTDDKILYINLPICYY